MTTWRPDRLDDFVAFAGPHVATGDVDPVYPVLREFFRASGFTAEQQVWRLLLYVTWYDLGSTVRAWRLAPDPRGLLYAEVHGWPTGVERRGHRGAGALEALRHIGEALAYARAAGGFAAWMREAAARGGRDGWRNVMTAFQRLHSAGPWAAYKFADLLAHVCGYPIEAHTVFGTGSGPARALAWLAAEPLPGVKEPAAREATAETLLAECRRRGVGFSGLDQLETSLCDFNSLRSGRYYVGHDIDQMQGQLHAIDDGRSPMPELFAARAAALPREYLGEAGGWDGVDKERCRAYADGGLIVLRK